MFQFMQGLYTNLSEIVQDVVFVSNVSLTFWDDQNKIVQKRLRDGKDLNGIGTTVEVCLLLKTEYLGVNVCIFIILKF